MPGAGLLYLHGGCYVLGSAKALCNLAGHIAVRIRANTFVADYRLAPENAFPAAVEDALAVYRAFTEQADRIVVSGDSAGGGLTLALLATLASHGDRLQELRGAAVMSPWTDLALTGASLTTQAEVDPLFTRTVLAHFAGLYLQGADPADPRASPLYGPVPYHTPPIRIDVGDAEVLLSDSLRYALKLSDAGRNVAVHVWAGMPHVFPSSIGRLKAADSALDEIGNFLQDCLRSARMEE
jgi:acetyl esterase/lipase